MLKWVKYYIKLWHYRYMVGIGFLRCGSLSIARYCAKHQTGFEK